MGRLMLLVVLGVVAVMLVAWALGRALFWLRATFPPRRRSR